ncbi:hypothetical protein MBGDC06_00373 [Thermoplasmatales archaeon SCGC AB-539-C06]|nr:hypothetical protein MBGDC06_00373 [Thermoplasmatales archaeon SCGC AB-539-C06]
MKSKREKKNNSFGETDKYSINDFIIDQNYLEKSLNFVGIAIKPVKEE